MQEKNANSFVDPEMTKRLASAIKEKYKSKSKFAKLIGASLEVLPLCGCAGIGIKRDICK